MRVTEGRMIERAGDAVTQSRQRVQQASQQISSGIRVAKASDDPTAWAAGARARARAVLDDARSSAVSRASDRLGETERALVSVNDDLGRASELATQLASDTYGAADRRSGAVEIRALRSSILASLDARDAEGSALFGGTLTGSPPFDATGAYRGDQGSASIEIADGTRVDIGLPGDRVSGGAGRDLIGLLDTLAVALDANDGAAIRASLDELRGSSDQVIDARSEVGRRMSAMQRANDTRADVGVVLDAQIERLVGADPITAATDLARASSGLAAARAAAEHMMQILQS